MIANKYFTNSTVPNRSIPQFLRFLGLALLLLIVLLALNLINGFSLFAIFFIALVYAGFRQNLHWLLALALPSLAFGQVIHVPLTPTWIYDATLSEALLTIAAAVFLLDIMISGCLGKVRLDGIALLLALYFLLAAASFFTVSDAKLYVAGLKVISYSLIAYWLALNLLKDQRSRESVYYGLALTVLIFSAQIFHKFYSLGFSAKFFFARSDILVPVGAIALVSAMLAFTLPVLLGRLFTPGASKTAGLVNLAALLAGLLAVFLMLGKGALVALFAGLFYFMHTAKRHRGFMLLSFMLFAVCGYLLFSPYLEGLYERFQTAVSDTNFEFRKQEYKIGVKIFFANPVYGVGAGQQLLYYQKLIDPYYRQLVNNFLLQAAIDFGLLGLGLVLLISFSLLVKTMKAVRQALPADYTTAGIAAGLLAAGINGLVEVTFFALPYAVLFWTVAGLLHGASPARDRSVQAAGHLRAEPFNA